MISKEYLDRMYARLNERKIIRIHSKSKDQKEAMDEAILAINCSIADYLETHTDQRSHHDQDA